MTKKTIKASDVLGDNYYIYELTSSNYTPALNESITITCTMKDVYGTVASGKSITLYQNGTSKGAQTTNSSGIATWSITCSTAGIQKFNIKNTSIEVFVDNKAVSSHQHGNITSDGKLTTSHNGTYSTFIGVQDSTGELYKASKINSDIIIDGTAHANIGSNANDNQSAINTAINTALGNKANSTHSHSEYLTSHQDITGKEDTSNKVTSLSENSTNTQYPSAKTVYDELMDTYTATLPSVEIAPSFTTNNVTKSVNGFNTGYDHFEKVVWDITFNDNTFQFFMMGFDETVIFFDGEDCYWGEVDGNINNGFVKGNLICEGNEVQVILNKDKTITINGIDTTWRVIDNIECFLFGNGSFSHTIYSHKYLDNDYLYYSTTMMPDINDTWEETINSITKEINELSSSFINNRPYWTTQGHFTITFNDNDFSYCHLGSSVDIYFDGTDCYWGEWDENNDNVMNKGTLICTGNVLYVYFGINPRSVYFPNGESNYISKSMAYFGDVEIKATYEVSRFELTSYKANAISSNDLDSDTVEYPNSYAIKQYAEKKSNKTSSWNNETNDTRYPTEKLVKDSLDGKEDKTNKVTSISSSSTNTQYPSAKCVYDIFTNTSPILCNLLSNVISYGENNDPDW